MAPQPTENGSASATGDTPGESGTVRWQEFLTEAETRLAAAGFESPKVDARRIVEEAAGFEPAELALRVTDWATERGVVRFDAMLSRRLAGEPLQYVLGRWGFRTLDLMVDARALIPRPETEVIAGLGLAELERQAGPNRMLRAVDLGTGTGAIGLSLLVERTDVHVLCTDVSEDAIALARANLVAVGRPAVRAELRCGSWFDALDRADRASFALIISNPPYVATGDELPPVVRDWEPASALISGADGLDSARHLIATAHEWLRPTGALVLELGETQLEAAAALADQAGFAEIEIHPDLAGRNRGLVARLGATS